MVDKSPKLITDGIIMRTTSDKIDAIIQHCELIHFTLESLHLFETFYQGNSIVDTPESTLLFRAIGV